MPQLTPAQRANKLLQSTYTTKHLQKLSDGCFHCEICARHYKGKKMLTAHMKVHLQSGSYNCSKCQWNFHNKNEWKRNEASHSDECLYVCARCGHCFKMTEGLHDHVRNCQVGKPLSDVKFHNCSHCKKDFSSKESLRCHLRDVLQDPYLCESCNCKYAQFSSYWHHKMSHERGIEDSKPSTTDQ